MPPADVGVEHTVPDDEESDDDDRFDEKETNKRSHWLVGGGKDNKVSIWTLMSFENTRA